MPEKKLEKHACRRQSRKKTDNMKERKDRGVNELEENKQTEINNENGVTENNSKNAITEDHTENSAENSAENNAQRKSTFPKGRDVPVATLVLMALNILVFIVGCFMGNFGGYFAGSDSNSLQQTLGMYENAAEPWRIITHGFVHFGVLHLASNMLCLFLFGRMLEKSIGRWRFVLLYMLSLLGGGIAVLLFGGNGLHAGASGAVWGLMATALVLYIKAQVSPAGILRGILFNLIYTFAAGASWQAHIGGGVIGLIAALILIPSKEAVKDRRTVRGYEQIWHDFKGVYALSPALRRQRTDEMTEAQQYHFEQYAAVRRRADREKRKRLLIGIAVLIILVVGINALSYTIGKKNAEQEAWRCAADMLRDHDEIRFEGTKYSFRDTDQLADTIMEHHVERQWRGLYFVWEVDYDALVYEYWRSLW